MDHTEFSQIDFSKDTHTSWGLNNKWKGARVYGSQWFSVLMNNTNNPGKEK